MICVYAMHSRVRKFKFVVDKKGTHVIIKKIIVQYTKASWAKYKNQINPKICYASSLELYKCWDSSPHATGGCRLLYTLYAILDCEFPRKILSSAFASNFPRFSLPLFKTKHLQLNTWRCESLTFFLLKVHKVFYPK